MTLEKFNNTTFNASQKVKYYGEVYKIAGVDFGENMICLYENIDNKPYPDLTIWAGYDEVEIIN